jgi:hypothetical protein
MNAGRRDSVPNILETLIYMHWESRKTYPSDYESQVLLLYAVLISRAQNCTVVRVATCIIEITNGSV